MEVHGTHASVAKLTYHRPIQFHSHISVAYTTSSLSLQLASSLGIMCFLFWDVNWIEHRLLLVAGQPGEAIREGIGDSEFHVSISYLGTDHATAATC